MPVAGPKWVDAARQAKGIRKVPISWGKEWTSGPMPFMSCCNGTDGYAVTDGSKTFLDGA